MAGGEEEEADFDTYFTVFDGSSAQDMFHAKLLWSSLSLLPPLESRLVSSDIRQRLPVARPHDTSAAARKPTPPDPRERLQDPRMRLQDPRTRLQDPRTRLQDPRTRLQDPRTRLQLDPNQLQRQEERQRYTNMAKQKEEIVSLLRKHREQRIQKESVSLPYKPKQSDKSNSKGLAPLKPSEDLEVDMEEVKQLQ